MQIGNLEHSSFAPENIATFFDSQGVSGIDAAQKLFTQWKNSPSHYQNMMNAGSTQIGIGISCGSTSCFGVTQFGKTG